MRRRALLALLAVAALLLGGIAYAATTTFRVDNADGSRIDVNCANLPTAITAQTTGRCNWTGRPKPTTTTSPTTTTTAATTTTTPATSTTTPSGGQWPNATNRGAPSTQALTTIPGDDFRPAANSVLDGVKVNALLVNQPNVTIRHSVVVDTIVIEDGGSLVIEDSTVGPQNCGTPTWYAAAINGGNYKAVRLHVRGHEDGFNAGGPNIEIRDSFVDICGHPGAHADGIQDYPRADGLVVDHNTFWGTTTALPPYTGEEGMNSPLFVNAGDKGQTVSNNVTLSNNLLLGGVFSMYLWPGTGTWDVHGNRVVDQSWWPGSGYGPYTAGGRCALLSRWDDNDTVTVDSDFRIVSTVQNDMPCNR